MTVSALLKHWGTVFSSATTTAHNHNIALESALLDSENVYSKYRDELDDYVSTYYLVPVQDVD